MKNGRWKKFFKIFGIVLFILLLVVLILFYQFAKPKTKRGEGEFSTFYNHDHVGARISEKILKRLRFSNEI